MIFSDEKETKRLLKEQSLFNIPIEKPKTKKLNNVDMLNELPFYDESNIVKTEKSILKICKKF